MNIKLIKIAINVTDFDNQNLIDTIELLLCWLLRV